MCYFVVKYRRKTPNDKTPYISHNAFLEFLWSFIPLVIFLAVFVWGWVVYHQMRTMPNNAFEVHVFGYRWAWDFTYKSGKSVTNELVVPVNRDVKLIMTSRDVIHSFFIPSLRIKQDVVPGRSSALWFNAKMIGDYQVFCTEFCGDNHSRMLAKIRVVTQDDFNQWIQENDAALPLAERGAKVHQGKCIACHSVTGTAGAGPTWKGLWGQKAHAIEGGVVDVDENYITESILNPNAKIAKGYPKGVMPAFQGAIKDEEIAAVIEYMKTLK
jgi:cytochrome c oxidase subunit II